jgi:hypothetical protein
MRSERENGPAGDYDWLSGCEGYRVDAPGGRIGVIEAIRRDPDGGGPRAIVVRAGRLRNRRLVIPASEIEALLVSGQTVVLAQTWSQQAKPAVP